jgi:hypothetical protein
MHPVLRLGLMGLKVHLDPVVLRGLMDLLCLLGQLVLMGQQQLNLFLMGPVVL